MVQSVVLNTGNFFGEAVPPVQPALTSEEIADINPAELVGPVVSDKVKMQRFKLGAAVLTTALAASHFVGLGRTDGYSAGKIEEPVSVEVVSQNVSGQSFNLVPQAIIEQDLHILPITIDTSIEGLVGLNAEQLNQALEGTGLAGLGEAFVATANKYNIPSDFIAAHAAVESDWGRHEFALERNNLFGYNAVDSNPNQATSFGSIEEGLDAYGSLIRNYYLTPGYGGPEKNHYHGPTIQNIFTDYSTAQDAEAKLVAKIMNELRYKVLP
jgi:hypothetical protein